MNAILELLADIRVLDETKVAARNGSTVAMGLVLSAGIIAVGLCRAKPRLQLILVITTALALLSIYLSSNFGEPLTRRGGGGLTSNENHESNY